MLEDAFAEWADYNERQKSDGEKEREEPPEMPVPEAYLNSEFLKSLGLTQRQADLEADDWIWQQRTIWDLRREYGLY